LIVPINWYYQENYFYNFRTYFSLHDWPVWLYYSVHKKEKIASGPGKSLTNIKQG